MWQNKLKDKLFKTVKMSCGVKYMKIGVAETEAYSQTNI